MKVTRVHLLIGGLVVLVSVGLICWLTWGSAADTKLRLEILPRPDQEKNPGSDLIWINRNLEQQHSFWADQLDEHLKNGYSRIEPEAKTVLCPPGRSNATHACALDVDYRMQCSLEKNGFGYRYGSGDPCIFVKLSNVQNWNPEPYKSLEDLTLAEERGMPDSLLSRIKDLIAKNSEYVETVWLSCDGVSSSDYENIGPIEYYASGIPNSEFPGFRTYYFPYLNQLGFRDPFVFIKFKKLQIGVLVQVRCRVWAKNIDPDDSAVEFEILLD